MTRFLPTLPHLLSSPGRPFIHRDLGGIQFNERVLAEARSSANPLLERLKFLAITASNLDEFFMIRYAALDRSIRLATEPAGRTISLNPQHVVGHGHLIGGQTSGNTWTSWRRLGTERPSPGSTGRPQTAKTFRMGQDIFAREILPHLPPRNPFGPIGSVPWKT
jgi:hypothetical protein